MLKKKILVRKVYNLTDARYFSAMNVDWISFQVPADEQVQWIKHYTEIMNWIEGPSFLLELGKENAEEQLNLLPNISGSVNLENQLFNRKDLEQFVIIPLENFLRAEKYILDRHNAHYLIDPGKPLNSITSTEKELLQKTGHSYPYMLDLSYENQVNNDILTLEGLKGLVFHGGAEEKTGVKSYELIDEWFDILLED